MNKMNVSQSWCACELSNIHLYLCEGGTEYAYITMEHCAQLFVMIPMNCLLLPLSPPSSKSISVLLFLFFVHCHLSLSEWKRPDTHSLCMCRIWTVNVFYPLSHTYKHTKTFAQADVCWFRYDMEHGNINASTTLLTDTRTFQSVCG